MGAHMTIIVNGTLVTPDGERRTSLAVEDGKIKMIGEIEPREGDEVLDASGCYVFPGFIDGHTHLDLPVAGTLTADDFASGTAAAVCGGTTTVVDFATQYKGDTVLNALETWKKKAEGKSRANYAFHMAICDWNEEAKKELPALREAGVTSFKVYMAYDTALTDSQILEVLNEVKKFGGVTGCHCENDAPINIVHLSTKLGLEEIRHARQEAEKAEGPDGGTADKESGFRIYVESCPQYMLLDDSNYSKENFEGAKYVCSPPLRKQEDIDALRKAVCSGEIDTIATDHCSFRFDTQKQAGRNDFTKIPNGAPGIEHRPVVFMKIFGDKLKSTDYCRLLSENPAKVFGMYPAKGALLEGSDADLVVWDPSVKWTISAANHHQNVDYTPFEGLEVKGRPKYVLVNGTMAAIDGEPTAAIAGRYVKR